MIKCKCKKPKYIEMVEGIDSLGRIVLHCGKCNGYTFKEIPKKAIKII